MADNINFSDTPDRYFTSGGLVYEYVRTDDEGRLFYRVVREGTADTNSPREYVIDPSKDLHSIIEEGIQNGVFVGPQSVESNPNGITRRSEAIFEWWRKYGSTPGTEEVTDDMVAEVCGDETYYREAVKWFLGYRMAAGLYTYRDLEGAITWLEVAYILYVVLGVSKPQVGIESVQPRDVNVSYKINEVGGRKQLEHRLSSYKERRWMKSYLKDLQTGVSYIPLTAYWAFVNLVKDGVHPPTEGKPFIKDGVLTVSNHVNLNKETWCLMEVSRSDFQNKVLSV